MADGASGPIQCHGELQKRNTQSNSHRDGDVLRARRQQFELTEVRALKVDEHEARCTNQLEGVRPEHENSTRCKLRENTQVSQRF